MAELRCPNCGRNNPDVLDVCQFCQTPLKPESVLRIGDQPTKKHTGELESVLPDWLKDVRQQARDSAEEESTQRAQSEQTKSQNEPADLLAGLASQAGRGDEEEVPDWLAGINPAAKAKPAAPSSPPPENDLFARLRQSESKPAFEADEPAQQEISPWEDPAANQKPASPEKDELSEWFSHASQEPEDTVEFDSDTGHDTGWGSTFDSPLPSPKEPAPKEEEDLSWLRNLEEAAKQTGDLKSPRQDSGWMANFDTPSSPSQSSQEDLSWLDSLGGIEEAPHPPSEQAAKSSDDLSWLNNFGATSEPSQPFDAAPDKPIASQPFASEEDLSWLNNLGGTAEPTEPLGAPAPETPEKPFSGEDLSWLNNLGGTSEQVPPFDAAAPGIPAQEEPSWLKDLGGESEPLSTPPFAETALPEEPRRQTAPLGQKPAQEDAEPDWLKSATEAPSMPPPGDLSMDWFTRKDQPEEKPAPAAPEPLSNQEVDSLFSMEMPDWLSQSEPAPDTPVTSQAPVAPLDSEESLSPVDLPSWVQAMRPMEAVISETTNVEDLPEEKEGPLAGLRGVIPGAPMGSSMRPKPISLKLQATGEQQSSAALLEQILGSETSPRALVRSSFVASQHLLRWALAGLFLLVLGAVIALGTRNLPLPSAALPPPMQSAADALESIPDNGRVLVVVDYEPSLVGEMEAVGGPLLTHLVSLRHPTLSFLSTSPSGSGLVERLLANTNVSRPAPEGLGYQPGLQYFNMGFLPGGSAGVLGFIESPSTIIPSAGVGSLSDYDALIVMSDHAESGRIWVEQLQNQKQIDLALADQPLLMVTSAQAGPLLQPYVSSGQIDGMISGLSQAARYDSARGVLPGVARSYWDAFGIGLAMSIALIVIGSLWSVFAAIRDRRAETQ